MNEKDNREKLDELREACNADPENTGAAIELAQFYSDLGWFNEALDLYKKLLEKCPDDFPLLLDYGNICFRRQELEDALKVFRRLTEIKPRRIEGWNNLGIVYLTRGEYGLARPAFDKVLRIEPNNAGALLNIGNCLFENRDFAAAAGYFEKAVAAAPDFADAWFNLGNAFREQEEYEKAVDAYRKALRYQPMFPSALKNLGYAYEQLGDFPHAEEYYTKALEHNRADAGLYRNLGALYVRLERTDEAKECFLKAVKLSPRDIAGWMGLRQLSLARGDIDSYVKATHAVISRLSGREIARTAATLRELLHFDACDAVLKAAEPLEKKSDELDVERLLAIHRNGGARAAEMTLEKKVRSLGNPGDAVLAGLGEYYYRKGDSAKALRCFGKIETPRLYTRKIMWQLMIDNKECRRVQPAVEEYLVNNPDFFDGWYLLARIHAVNGDRDRAKGALIRALETGFSDMDVIEGDSAMNALLKEIASENRT